eukprot:GGOE01002212.1.p1 GENE.GGOE01002212.1~~GGOE01002212.1.p1  ORF type:complete len:552 (-),score=123.32 GGOE01002212.1:330-1760(-)
MEKAPPAAPKLRCRTPDATRVTSHVTLPKSPTPPIKPSVPASIRLRSKSSEVGRSPKASGGPVIRHRSPGVTRSVTPLRLTTLAAPPAQSRLFNRPKSNSTVEARPTVEAHRSLPSSPAFPLDFHRASEGAGSASSRTESTLPGTGRSSLLEEDLASHAAAAELRDSVARITKNNQLLQAEMERTRGELKAMAESWSDAELRGQEAQLIIADLSDDLQHLRRAKAAAERDLAELKDQLRVAQESLTHCATQTDLTVCLECDFERDLRQRAQQDRIEAQREVSRLRGIIIDGQRQLAASESQCCEWQRLTEVEREARRRAERERESIKATALQISRKWEDAQVRIKNDAQHIAELRHRVALLEAQHAQMGSDLRQTRAHLKQLQVAMEVRDERDAGQSPIVAPTRWLTEGRAHLQAEEILYRTYIEAEQASAWQLMLAERLPHLPASPIPAEMRHQASPYSQRTLPSYVDAIQSGLD